MKLYKVPRGTMVRVIDEERKVPPAAPEIKEDEIIYFGHIDGMYSYCTNAKDEVIHLAAWTEVEIVEERILSCYQCEKNVTWLADDSRCKDCTRLTPEEVQDG